MSKYIVNEENYYNILRLVNGSLYLPAMKKLVEEGKEISFDIDTDDGPIGFIEIKFKRYDDGI